MRKFIILLLSALMLLSGYAWATTPASTSDSKAKKEKKCLFPKSKKRAPSWVCNEQADTLAVAAVGSFAKSGAGIEFMEQMAAADARVHLARKLNATVQKKINEIDAAANHDQTLISNITEESLQSTKVLKKVNDPKGKLYVLIGFDEAGTQKLHESIAASYLKQKRK